MMLRERRVQRIACGGCDLVPGPTLAVTIIGTSFFRFRLRRRLRLWPSQGTNSSLQILCDRLHRQLFHVTRARCRAVRFPRADLPDEERRVLCRPATPPSTSL